MQEAPTAAASVVKLFPILKDVLAVFGLIASRPPNLRICFFSGELAYAAVKHRPDVNK